MTIGINFSSGQEVEILVCDSLSKEPIAYAYYFQKDNNRGGYTGEDGVLKASLDKNGMNEVGALGYKQKVISFLSDDTIFLLPESIGLSEVLVTGSVLEKETIGISKKDKGRLSISTYSPFAQEAIYIPNEKQNKSIILSLNVQGDNRGNNDKSNLLRLRIYTKGDNDLPYKDLLIKDEFVSINGNDWTEIDISHHGITFPVEGVFIAFEWLDSEGYFFKSSEGAVLKSYTPKIRGRKINPDTGMYWVRYDPITNRWEYPYQVVIRTNPDLDPHYLDDYVPSVSITVGSE